MGQRLVPEGGKVKLSIKTKVNLWFSAIMMLVVGATLCFMLLVSDRIVESTSKSELERMVGVNARFISYEDDELKIDDGFLYYTNGIDTLIYSADFTLVAGQRPTGYDKSMVPFRNGKITKTEISGKEHYVYDTYIYFGKNNGVWLRGILEKRETESFIKTITSISVVALPLLVILASIGGHIITLRAFEPVNRIIKAANDIRDGNDLSARIDLGEARDEIYYLALTFDKMFERLEASFASEKEFASNASHELRTPLSVITAECEYLNGSDDIEEYKESVAVIKRQAAKMTDLVSRLLQITRLEQGTIKLSTQRVNLSGWVGSLCEARQNNHMNVTVTAKAGNDIFINADTALFGMCLDNLFDNAIKYNKPGGSLTVSTYEDEEYAYVSFEDTGTGISKESLPYIFDRFYRQDTSRNGDSFGLGLFLTKQIVGLHDGEISVSSREGEGSRFEIKIKKLQ